MHVNMIGRVGSPVACDSIHIGVFVKSDGACGHTYTRVYIWMHTSSSLNIILRTC